MLGSIFRALALIAHHMKSGVYLEIITRARVEILNRNWLFYIPPGMNVQSNLRIKQISHISDNRDSRYRIHRGLESAAVTGVVENLWVHLIISESYIPRDRETLRIGVAVVLCFHLVEDAYDVFIKI